MTNKQLLTFDFLVLTVLYFFVWLYLLVNYWKYLSRIDIKLYVLSFSFPLRDGYYWYFFISIAIFTLMVTTVDAHDPCCWLIKVPKDDDRSVSSYTYCDWDNGIVSLLLGEKKCCSSQNPSLWSWWFTLYTMGYELWRFKIAK